MFDPQRHHRHSIRLPRFNYARDGFYFVTICTEGRECFFGEISDGEMYLNPLGGIVDAIWGELPEHFPNAELDAFIIMPNHVHFVLRIEKWIQTGVEEDAMDAQNGGFAGGNNPMLHQNLPRMIRWFKGRTTFECRKTHTTFAWQRNYYECVVRSERHYENIAEYIKSNPSKWNPPKPTFQTPKNRRGAIHRVRAYGNTPHCWSKLEGLKGIEKLKQKLKKQIPGTPSQESSKE
jgi:REP element-mobilizing transposase RayT